MVHAKSTNGCSGSSLHLAGKKVFPNCGRGTTKSGQVKTWLTCPVTIYTGLWRCRPNKYETKYGIAVFVMWLDLLMWEVFYYGHVTPQLFYIGHVTPSKCAILVIWPEKVSCMANIERAGRFVHPRKMLYINVSVWNLAFVGRSVMAGGTTYSVTDSPRGTIYGAKDGQGGPSVVPRMVRGDRLWLLYMVRGDH